MEKGDIIPYDSYYEISIEKGTKGKDQIDNSILYLPIEFTIIEELEVDQDRNFPLGK